MTDLSIPGFELIELLGRGGMASVWKARQVSLDRVVAIKILSSHFSSDSADVDRFQDEARAAARMKHSGIVQVYDASTQDGMYYFVMEYVAGYTVGSWLRRKGVLPESDALLVCECVADALDYAWTQAGIIHCDIKPDNIIVDSDGTVKVADLGLSRTISTMSRLEEQTDEVMGTPSYISPEQAMGEPDLDCRADVYSLGAMLYHLVTGQRPFKGHPDADVMELQCTGKLASPASIVPGLSVPLCMLLEKMMAKDKAHRQADWQEVKADIARVKRCLPLRHPLALSAESTVTRTPRSAIHQGLDPVHRNLRRWKKRDSSSRLALGIAGGLLLFLLLIWMIARSGVPPHQVPPSQPPVTGGGAGSPVPRPKPGKTLEERAAVTYRQVTAWVAAHPDELTEGMNRLRNARADTTGTPYCAKIDRELGVIQEKIANTRQKVMDSLQVRARQFEDAGEWNQAVAVYTQYAGAMVDETVGWRMRMAASVRARATQVSSQESQPTEVVSAEALDVTVSRVVNTLMESGPSAAALVVREALKGAGTGPQAERLTSLEKVLLDTAQLDARVMQSFEAHIGEEIDVSLRAGVRSIRVDRVVDGRVIGTSQMLSSGVVNMPVAFSIQDLSITERLRRMGDDTLPEVALGKGLMAMGANALPRARDFFGGTHELIAEKLQEFVSEKQKPQAPVAAPSVPRELPSASLPRELEAVRDDAGAVHDMLIKKNPQLLPHDVVLEMDGPNAVGVEIRSAEGMDIGPLAALTTLTSFVLRSPGRAASILKDLSPLSRLPLNNVVLDRSRVSDLGPLANCPLTSVSIRECPVRDLVPLRRKALTYLDVSGSNVLDLGPLAGMQLEYIDFSRTSVRRLSVLSGMPLHTVLASGCSLSELSVLAGLRLTRLDIADTQVKDLSVLAGMPLAHLDVSRTRVADISRLTNLQLKTLKMSGVSVHDFTPIQDMPITKLDLSETDFGDPGLLAGMPLTELQLKGTRVSDLQALSVGELTSLNIEGTSVSDLSPLQNAPLTFFACRNSGVTDLWPLHGAPIKVLFVDNPVKHAGLIRSLDELVSLNGESLLHDLKNPFFRGEGEARRPAAGRRRRQN